MVLKRFKSLPVYRLKLVKDRRVKYPFQVNNNAQASAVFLSYLGGEATEHLAVLLLDGQYNFLGISTVAIGGLAGITLHVRSIFAHVITGRAHSFIVGHNHPSGDPSPSDMDISFTRDMKEASHIMGIEMLDHIIVSSGLNKNTYSFLANGFFDEKNSENSKQIQQPVHNAAPVSDVSRT